VFLDEFADTDDEVDDEEAEEREVRLEERRKVSHVVRLDLTPDQGQIQGLLQSLLYCQSETRPHTYCRAKCTCRTIDNRAILARLVHWRIDRFRPHRYGSYDTRIGDAQTAS
jgi:methylaspartate ammonia-lyase